jgi:tetratricopeptide (TPR) repeat protein
MLIKEYPEHPIAVRSRQALLHYARVQQDQPERLALLNDLTYQVKRTEAAKQACVDASIELAELHFFAQRFDQGEQALATTHAPPQLFTEVYNLSAKTVAHLLANPDTRAAAEKLADQLLGALRDEADAHPDLAKGLLYRAADLNTSLTRHSETWKLYEEIATRFGRDDPLLTQMATWLKQRGKRDEAREIYARFSDPVAGTKHLAAMLIEEDKPTEAIGVFRKLIEIDGQHAGEHLWSIAACYEKLSDWKKALAIYQQVERFPDDHFRMAACHRKLGNHNEAIVLYKQCKLSDESAPEATLQIAFTYEEANDKQQAIRTFQLTCKRYPKAEQASRAHAHLQNQYNINVTLGGSE